MSLDPYDVPHGPLSAAHRLEIARRERLRRVHELLVLADRIDEPSYDPLERLRAVEHVEIQLGRVRRAAVQEAVEGGLSWRIVGHALGLSAGTARRRFESG